MKMRNVIFQGAAITRALTLVALAAGLAVDCHAEDIQLRSRWDEDLLNIELHDVVIATNTMVSALDEIMTKYLLRANVYLAQTTNLGSTGFAFDRKKCLGSA